MNITHRNQLWKLLLDNNGPVAEIGVAEGRFSADILGWPLVVPKLYLVDRWRHFEGQAGDASNSQEWHDKNLADVKQRIASFLDRVIILQGESTSVVNHVMDRSLALVYIDADHSYRGVMKDILAWLPKLKPGGVMAFHDYENTGYGVKRAVTDFTAGKFHVYLIPEDKPEDAGAWFRIDG